MRTCDAEVSTAGWGKISSAASLPCMSCASASSISSFSNAVLYSYTLQQYMHTVASCQLQSLSRHCVPEQCTDSRVSCSAQRQGAQCNFANCALEAARSLHMSPKRYEFGGTCARQQGTCSPVCWQMICQWLAAHPPRRRRSHTFRTWLHSPIAAALRRKPAGTPCRLPSVSKC